MTAELTWWIVGGVALAVAVAVVKNRTSGEDFTDSQYPGRIDKQAAPAPLRDGGSTQKAMSTSASMGTSTSVGASTNVGTSTSLSQQDLAVLQKLVQRGQLIEAMKHFRQKTGLGLKEAKDVVSRLAGK